MTFASGLCLVSVRHVTRVNSRCGRPHFVISNVGHVSIHGLASKRGHSVNGNVNSRLHSRNGPACKPNREWKREFTFPFTDFDHARAQSVNGYVNSSLHSRIGTARAQHREWRHNWKFTIPPFIKPEHTTHEFNLYKTGIHSRCAACLD